MGAVNGELVARFPRLSFLLKSCNAASSPALSSLIVGQRRSADGLDGLKGIHGRQSLWGFIMLLQRIRKTGRSSTSRCRCDC